MTKKHNKNKLYSRADLYDLINSFYFDLIQLQAKTENDTKRIYKYTYAVNSKEAINFLIKQLIVSIPAVDLCSVFHIKNRYFKVKISEIKKCLNNFLGKEF